MERWVPVWVLDEAEHAAFVSDEDGRIDYCNAAAVALLKRDRGEIEGQRCCEVLRLRSLEGKLLCRKQCAVQTQARGGKLEKTRPALFSVNGDAPTQVELSTLAVSPPSGRRIATLHVIKISANARIETVEQEGGHQVAAAYARLSPREREVLRHLADGKGTGVIAEELFVSSATVRNHVRSILAKLRVHSRIEAVLASFTRV